MPLYIKGYKPTLSKDELIDSIVDTEDMLEYGIDLIKLQLEHEKYEKIVENAESLKTYAQDLYNYKLNLKELEKNANQK